MRTPKLRFPVIALLLLLLVLIFVLSSLDLFTPPSGNNRSATPLPPPVPTVLKDTPGPSAGEPVGKRVERTVMLTISRQGQDWALLSRIEHPEVVSIKPPRKRDLLYVVSGLDGLEICRGFAEVHDRLWWDEPKAEEGLKGGRLDVHEPVVIRYVSAGDDRHVAFFASKTPDQELSLKGQQNEDLTLVAEVSW